MVKFDAIFSAVHFKTLAAFLLDNVLTSPGLLYEQLLESDSKELEVQSAGLAMNLHGPRWNSHSCRRGGTKKAREGPASREMIDAHFRWGAKEAKRQQQVAYASLEEAARRMEVTAHF
jgi:hypothetical protein